MVSQVFTCLGFHHAGSSEIISQKEIKIAGSSEIISQKEIKIECCKTLSYIVYSVKQGQS